MITAARLLAVFDGPPSIPGGPGGQMKCPTCGEHSQDAWKQVYWADADVRRTVRERKADPDAEDVTAIRLTPNDQLNTLTFDWMRCNNSECRRIVVRAHTRELMFSGSFPLPQMKTWTVYPLAGATHPLDPVVPDQYRNDFDEAHGILARSPRMSAVLSRRILADLLEQYAGKTQYNLADRIDSFVKDTSHPVGIRENLQHLRELGDFSAHTKKNDQAEVIPVDSTEAEWTLVIVERLLDYFAIGPAKDAAMRAKVDEKIKAAGRKPIEPPPDRKRP